MDEMRAFEAEFNDSAAAKQSERAVRAQTQKLAKTRLKLQEAQALQGTYQGLLKQLQADHAIVTKDLADVEQACDRAEREVLSLQKQLQQRAADSNTAVHDGGATLRALNQLRAMSSTALAKHQKDVTELVKLCGAKSSTVRRPAPATVAANHSTASR
jgi:predicted  nucleic acid-binding Zn-ribbon protein